MKEIILKVEGMMCGGCENRVQNAIGEIEGVVEVKASHTEKTVKITANEQVSENLIKETIDDLGYTIID